MVRTHRSGDVLALRGPQTSAELRANCDRLHRFADVSSVEAFLEELAARPAEKGGALVVKLPRAPGAREARWAQLLGGPVDLSALPVAPDPFSVIQLPLGELGLAAEPRAKVDASARARAERAEARVAALESELETLSAERSRDDHRGRRACFGRSRG